MLDQTPTVPESASEILGDLTALAEQLGGTEGLGPLSRAAAGGTAARVDSVPALAQFLEEYRTVVLFPHELPAILKAYEYASRGHVRELVALDRELHAIYTQHGFAKASSHVGRTQLRRLRPLRTERVVQRYGQAVAAGEAQAWHALVFGLVLAVYSLPLRQGLIHFAHQTLGGFVNAASVPLGMKCAQVEELIDRQAGAISAGVESVISRRLPLNLSGTTDS